MVAPSTVGPSDEEEEGDQGEAGEARVSEQSHNAPENATAAASDRYGASFCAWIVGRMALAASVIGDESRTEPAATLVLDLLHRSDCADDCFAAWAWSGLSIACVWIFFSLFLVDGAE